MDDELLKLFGEPHVVFGKCGDGAPQAVIDEAERTLALSFPPSYRWWLKNYGGGQLRGDIVYGLDVEDQGRSDIVKLALKNESKGREGRRKLVFVIGNEEQFYFDTTAPAADGEYPVYHFDALNGEPTRYAESFSDFLRRRIVETRP